MAKVPTELVEDDELPPEVAEAIRLFTLLMVRFKEFLKRDRGEYIIWLGWFCAGMGAFGFGWMVLQFQLLLFQLQQLQAGGMITWALWML